MLNTFPSFILKQHFQTAQRLTACIHGQHLPAEAPLPATDATAATTQKLQPRGVRVRQLLLQYVCVKHYWGFSTQIDT